jgi:hypothetical protein
MVRAAGCREMFHVGQHPMLMYVTHCSLSFRIEASVVVYLSRRTPCVCR